MEYLRVLDPTGICSCVNNYFDDGVRLNCQTCHYSCLKCSSRNDKTKCTECDAGKFRELGGASKSECICMNRYYE